MIETVFEMAGGAASSASAGKAEAPRARNTSRAAAEEAAGPLRRAGSMGGGADRRDACPALRRCRYFRTAQMTSTSSSSGTAAMRPTWSRRYMVRRRATDQRISTSAMVTHRLLRSGAQRQPPQHDQAEHERADLHHHLHAAIDLQPHHREARGQRLLAGVEDFGEAEGLAGARHFDADRPHARGRGFGLRRSEAPAPPSRAAWPRRTCRHAPRRHRCGGRSGLAGQRSRMPPEPPPACAGCWAGAAIGGGAMVCAATAAAVAATTVCTRGLPRAATRRRAPALPGTSPPTTPARCRRRRARRGRSDRRANRR